MIEKIKKHKWKIHSCVCGILLLLFVFTAIFFEDKNWLPNILQTIGTVIGIYLTVIIFLYSKEDSDKQFREHLGHLQELNAQQILALQTSTKEQIEALQFSTNQQISSFEREIREVTNKLSDNSILLAEILRRELEKSIETFNTALKTEEAKYSDLSGWKLFRTKEEKEQQLNNQWTKIQNFKRTLEYLVTKYNQVRQFLGFETKQLNGK